MRRYHVIKKISSNNEHINDHDLLPASCKLITGIAVCTTVKKEADAISSTVPLAFPLGLIKRLLASDRIANLFYSYMQTRPTLEESKAFFETDILPEIVNALCNGITYPILTHEQQTVLSNNLSNLLMGESEQAEINWDERFEELKESYRASFFDFIRDSYEELGVNPDINISEGYINNMFIPQARGYSLYRISIQVYYVLRNNGQSIPYSAISKNINTYGNSILQSYDSQLVQLQNEKTAYEQAETLGLSEYLFTSIGIFDKGKNIESLGFLELISQEILSFIKQNKTNLFVRPVEMYERPEPYECGSLSLLVNGNSFLLCDYILTANRKIKHLSKEIIPFSEPLEVNSSLQTVFKSNLKSGTEPLNIRIYIQYEDFKEPLAKVEPEKQEATV
jgi:hypothetical protein